MDVIQDELHTLEVQPEEEYVNVTEDIKLPPPHGRPKSSKYEVSPSIQGITLIDSYNGERSHISSTPSPSEYLNALNVGFQSYSDSPTDLTAPVPGYISSNRQLQELSLSLGRIDSDGERSHISSTPSPSEYLNALNVGFQSYSDSPTDLTAPVPGYISSNRQPQELSLSLGRIDSDYTVSDSEISDDLNDFEDRDIYRDFKNEESPPMSSYVSDDIGSSRRSQFTSRNLNPHKPLRPDKEDDGELVPDYHMMKALISENRLEAYRQFCSSLKRKCNEIVDVAATKASDDDYVFVVITPTPEHTERNAKKIFPKLRDYPVTYRDVLNEGKLVQDKITEGRKGKGVGFNYKMESKVRQALIKYGDDLMDQHKNLNAVHFSPCKSVGFLAGHLDLKVEQCIVLYVNIKFPERRVPIGEKEFPRDIDGVPVDVRESYIVPLTHIGQEIVSNVVKKSASLGPIVKFPDDSLGFFTSMHAIINDADMSSIDSSKGINILSPSVHNAISNNDGKEIGFVHEIHYRKGTSGREPGFEVGLIKFYPGKQPPDATFSADHENGNLHFNGAQYLPSIPDNHLYTQVFKYGAASGLTRGIFDTIGPNINRLKCRNDDNGIKICDQYGVLGIEGFPFATYGDSGAIVVLPYSGDANDLRAVGIVTGQMATGQYLVSPMAPILESFPGFELKRYTSEPMIID